MRYLLIFAVVLLPFMESCKKGCRDNKALNYDSDAAKDDGSCRFSNVVFYGQYPAFNGIPIVKIEVTVNGENLGSITSFYPSGPGNCSATGTINYPFRSGELVDWNTTVLLANGNTVFGSGQVTADRFTECLKVNVTK
jgi:hypothetical protein